MGSFPAAEIRKLFDIVGNIDRLLLAQAILILVVAGVAIAVSIYNSMSERRREIAILRALGARRATIFSIVLLEAVTICLVGSAVGLIGGHLVVAAANGVLYKASGFVIPAFHIVELEWYILGVAVVLGALSGLGPAWGAYRTDVARNLAPTS
jgi:putative ABC transport system permease protein